MSLELGARLEAVGAPSGGGSGRTRLAALSQLKAMRKQVRAMRSTVASLSRGESLPAPSSELKAMRKQVRGPDY